MSDMTFFSSLLFAMLRRRVGELGRGRKALVPKYLGRFLARVRHFATPRGRALLGELVNAWHTGARLCTSWIFLDRRSVSGDYSTGVPRSTPGAAIAAQAE